MNGADVPYAVLPFELDSHERTKNPAANVTSTGK